MKYLVRAEVRVESTDFVTYEVEANSKEEAKLLAVEEYENGTEPIDRWASDYIESEIDKQFIADWDIDEVTQP